MLRLAIISFTAIIISFLILYLILSLLLPAHSFSEYGFIPLLLGCLLIMPLHKLLHCIPLWISGNKAYITFHPNRGFLCFHCHIPNALSRRLSIVTVLSPILFLTIVCIAGSWFSPEHMHYFVIFASINIGLSVYDLIYVIQLIKAPKHAFIEDHNNGFHILINKIA